LIVKPVAVGIKLPLCHTARLIYDFKAMGHSSLNVSLTYLRGLEIAELNEEDMPMV
jgi:hypothetical protein